MGIIDVVFTQLTNSVFLVCVVTALLLIFFIASSIFSSQRNGKEPPRPRAVPLVGNLLQLDLKRLDNSLMELSRKYGSVFTVYLGPKKVVILAGYKTVKEALVDYDEVFGDRISLKVLDDYSQGHGLLWSNGETWKEMRRFALTNLRDFGMGKRACEDKIIEECQHLIDIFENFKGEAFDTTHPINCAVSNITCSIVYGSRFEYNDPEFTSMIDRVNRNAKILGSPSIQVCRGFVDAFLVRKQNLEASGITNSHFHDDNLLITVMNLFAAGTETTSTTLRWGLLLMAKYPKIQDEVQEELRRVIGDRQVQVADRKNLPFTDAVIHETQRLSSILPTALPHKTTRDITFQGHFIEKGTTVFPLLISVLHDPNEWERPHSFYPAHFLDKEKKFVKRDAFIPFSAGRRICLGESLARMELFLFFTTLLQHFRFTPAPGVSEDELDLTPAVGFTLSPSIHKLCAVSQM
ncbi:cytochrome P450 2K4-like isoform X3 [Oreochromis aureus]|uniref:cytochrome P450 2K4-like isoform X3 n=1 Tax=Oreochromis aureus TaxID=47969 RepID=UPI001952EB75|nr:cytochrome P450 2K4-like isoform X3 [Oreochromis aureus]